jgi:hypothetical protein
MSETQSTLDNFSDDENGTLILVDATDTAIGSISLAERLAVETEHLIHRTCSLHIFWNKDQMEKVNDPTSCLLLSSLYPAKIDWDERYNQSNVRIIQLSIKKIKFGRL